MTLEFQQIPIPFAAGVDTLTDKFQIPVGKLAALENGVFTRNGSISLRNGFDPLTTGILSGGNISAAKALATYGDELVLLNGVRLYSYSEGQETWVDKGPCPVCRGISVEVAQHAVSYTTQPINPDMAYGDGMHCITWTATTIGVKYSIVDALTDAEVVSDQLISHADAANGKYSVCVWYEGAFRIFWLVVAGGNAGTLMSTSVTPDGQTETSSAELTGCEVATSGANAALAAGFTAAGVLVVVVGTVAAGTHYWTAIKFDAAFDQSDTYTSPGSAAGKFTALSVATSTAGVVAGYDGVWILASETDSTSKAHIHWWGSAGAELHTYAYATTAVTAVGHIVGVDVAGTLHAVWEVQNGGTDHHNTWRALATVGAGPGYAMSIGTPAVFLRGVSISGGAFSVGGLAHYPVSTEWLGATTGSGTIDPQSTHYLVSDTGDVVSKHSDGEGGARLQYATCPAVCSVATGVYAHAALRTNLLVSVFCSVRGVPNCTVSKWDFSATSIATEVQGNQLHIAGGILRSYDGSECVEHGFLAWPHITATSSGSGGTIPADIYSYGAIYRWRDALGQYHDSLVGYSAEVTTTGSTSSVSIVVPCLRLTNKAITDVECIVFRTQGAASGDSSYYKLASVTNAAATSVTITDDGSYDAALPNQEVLYVTGGIVPNSPPPSGHLIATAKSRMYVSDGEVVWFSKVLQNGRPVEWSDTNLVTVEPRGGEISAIGVMDSTLLIWKTGTGCYQLYGDGPDNTGGGAPYTEPTLVSTDIGCNSPKSLGLTPDGLVFKSRAGINRLSRSLQTEYIGAPVEAYNAQTVTSSVVLSDKNEVRFLCSDGNAIVYNSLFQQWGLFTIQGVDAVVWKTAYAYVTAAGVVWVEGTTHADDGTAIQLLVETPWYSFAGLNNYQKASKFLLLGAWQGAHNLTVDTQFDLVPTWGTAATIPQTTPVAVDSPVQVTVHLSKQKTQSVKVRIKALGTGTGDTIRLSGLTFTVGLKRGPFRHASTKHFGA